MQFLTDSIRSIVSFVIVLAVLGAPGRAECVGDLKDLVADLASTDRSVREQAATALMECGTDVVEPLTALLDGEDGDAANAARLTLAGLVQRSVAEGDRQRGAMAEALLAQVRAERPLLTRRWLLRQVSYVAGDRSVPALAELLGDADLGDMALFALDRIPGDLACEALMEAAPRALVPVRLGVIHAVGRRGDPATVRWFLPFLQDVQNELIKTAAAQALARIPDPLALHVTWRSLAEMPGDKQLRERAIVNYLELAATFLRAGDREQACVMYAYLYRQGLRPQYRCAGLAGLVEIEGVAALPQLLEATLGSQSDLAGVAVEALAGLDGQGVSAAMAKLIPSAPQEIRPGLVHAILRRGEPATVQVVESMFAAMKSTPGVERAEIVKTLGESADTRFKELYLRTTGAASEELLAAGLSALGRLQDPATLPRLLEVAAQQIESAIPRAAAIAACVRVGEGLAAKEPQEALQAYEQVLAFARSDDEKKLVIDRLGRLGSTDAVALIEPFLDRPSSELQQAAAGAIAPLAMKLAGGETRNEAVILLKKVVFLSTNPGLVQRAAAKLDELGVEVDVPVRKGYIKNFWLLGPLTGRDELRKIDLVEPTATIDLKQTVIFANEEFTWRHYRLDHLLGMVDLLRVVARANDVGVYAFAQVKSPEAREAVFEIGSDDDVFCWLNQELVFRFEGGRGWTADQDSVKVNLKSGINTILLKVLNGGGGWAFSLRVTDGAGHPLSLSEATPDRLR